VKAQYYVVLVGIKGHEDSMTRNLACGRKSNRV